MKTYIIRDTREIRIDNIARDQRGVENGLIPLCTGHNDECKRTNEFVEWEEGLSGTLVERLNCPDHRPQWQWVGWKDVKPREAPPPEGVYR